MAEFVPLISHQCVFLCLSASLWLEGVMNGPCPAVSRISRVTASSSTTNCLRYLIVSLLIRWLALTYESSMVGLYPLTIVSQCSNRLIGTDRS
jgi:hypothetical protein